MASTQPAEHAQPGLPKRLLTRPEVARLFKKSISAIKRMEASGALARLKLGASVRFDPRDVQACLDAHRKLA